MTQEAYTFLSFLFIALAGGCYGIQSRIAHGSFRFSSNTFGFWGKNGDLRKYKDYSTIPAPNTWYYRLFKIDYKERFPLSATALVFLTDGFHFVQFFTIKFIVAAVICWKGDVSLGSFIAVWVIWLLAFNASYLGFKE